MRAAVVGVGNILLKDEGVGVHVIRALEEEGFGKAAGVELIDAGTSPDLPFLISPFERILIVDAARFGGEPGEIRRFQARELLGSGGGLLISAHDLGLAESLFWLLALGEGREVRILGVEPAEIGWGLELSPKLREKLPKIIRSVKEEANALLGAEAL